MIYGNIYFELTFLCYFDDLTLLYVIKLWAAALDWTRELRLALRKDYGDITNAEETVQYGPSTSNKVVLQ